MSAQGKAVHYRWEDQPSEAMKGTITRRIISSERIMFGEVRFRKGDTVPKHAHENEQFTYVVSGTLRFWLGEDGAQQVDVNAGEVLVIPSNLPHSAEAIEDVVEFDIFNPPRQDWLDKSDAYLRG
ncbi:MAG: cupin domain-containing protein [Beijerinckiaceae bacterium]